MCMVLIVAILTSLRGITVIGEPQTFEYLYGLPTLLAISSTGLLLGAYQRKNDKKLAFWLIILTFIFLAENFIISSLFTY